MQWTISCDRPRCEEYQHGERGWTAAEIRNMLRAEGWAVAVPHPNPNIRQRQDFCPDHKPQGAIR
jgi:hypothetical protein